MFQFKLPDIGEGVHEGEIVKWHVATGDTITENQPMVDVMTDKVTVEITSPTTGTVAEILFAEGQTAHVGDIIVNISADGSVSSPNASTESAPTTPVQATAATPSSAKAPAAKPATVAPVVLAPSSGQKVLAAPAVRRLARTQGIDLSRLRGSAHNGRITKTDLITAINAGTVAPAQPTTAVAQHQPAVITIEKDDTLSPFRGIRRKIAEHLVKSKHIAPHFTYAEEADLTDLNAKRATLKEQAVSQGTKLTFLPFIAQATCLAIKKWPIINSQLDEHNQQIVQKPVVNLGVAIATDNGLVVPVIHGAEKLTLIELAKKIDELANLARNNKLPLEAMQGGTFTLTSIGSIGGVFSAPIINYPEVAIMGIQKVAKRPVVKTVDGQDNIVIREMTTFSISCDHRVVDGADAAYFMRDLIAYLESPEQLLAESPGV